MAVDNQELAPAPTPRQGGYLSSWPLAIVTGSLCLGIFLFGLDINIIGVAIPRITTEFNSLGDVAWYGSAYLLTVTAFQPFFGSLYKYLNAKLVYLVSLFIFEVGSAISASAPVSSVLILGRAVLGFGAAGLLQGALAIISYIVPIDRVPLFQGIVISSLAVSTCVGPVIGGLLTEYATWSRNVPTGVCVIIIVILFVPAAKPSGDNNSNSNVRSNLRKIDGVGTAIFIAAICCLLLALTWAGHTYPWNSSTVIGLFVGAFLLAICFCYWIWRQKDLAIIPLRILRKRSISMGAAALFGLGVSLNVYGYYLPIFFQSAQGVSTVQSGVQFIALVASQVVALVITGAIVSVWGYYVPYMIAGVAIASVGAGLLTTIGLSTSTVVWAAYLVVIGIGMGMALQLPYTALQAVLDPADVATGNAIAVFSFHMAGAIGIVIGQNLFITELQAAVPEYTTVVSPDQVIGAGATGLVSLAPTPAVLQALRQAYADSVRRIFLLGLAAVCLALPPSCFMEWLNIKQVAAERRLAQEDQSHTGIPKPEVTGVDGGRQETEDKE
ncbi:MFS general substrate transporter [Thozetella sp. PMI_491]|nr:MFS general substrate transporter [Thozetella sp. PMI_491]